MVLRAAAVNAQDKIGGGGSAAAGAALIDNLANLSPDSLESCSRFRRCYASQRGNQCGLQLSVAGPQQVVGLALSEAGQVPHDTVDSLGKLFVGDADIHHQVAKSFAEADHGAGGEHVQNQFGGRARLETCRTAEDFRADDGRNGQIDMGNQLRVGIAGQSR